MNGSKLWSARFWLAIMAGIVFAYSTCAKLLNSEAVASIVTMVFMAYFSRTDRTAPDTNGDTATTATMTTSTTITPKVG